MTIQTIQKLLGLLILTQPVCAIVLGLLCWRCPPKGPTWAFGYRSRRARASDQSWQFAQGFAGRLWLCLGLVLLIPALVVSMGLGGKNLEDSVGAALTWTLIQAGCLLLSMIPTEIILLRKFDYYGRLRGTTSPPAPVREYESTGRVELPEDVSYEDTPLTPDGYPVGGFFPEELPFLPEDPSRKGPDTP